MNTSFFNLICQVKYWLQNALMSPPSPGVNELIGQLRSEIRKLPELPMPTSEAEAEWLYNRRNVRNFFLKNDPRKLFFCDVLIHTMVVGNAPYTSEELDLLTLEPSWSARWKYVVTETSKIKPKPHHLLPSSSGNTIHHTYHIKTFEEYTKQLINDTNLILEFGGGYGNMCRLIHKLGFKGKYIIFDLPEFSLIQKFYLKENGLDVQMLGNNFKELESGIFLCSDMEVLNSEVMNENIDLFLATWSFSEAPLEIRENFIPFIRNSRYCFFAYQNKFQDIENLPYFSKLGNNLEFESWNCEISFLPGNHYQILSKTI